MKKKIAAAVLLVMAFAAFTFLVKTYDVAPAGPGGTVIGFSGVNSAFHGYTGENYDLYVITDWLGYLALAVCAFFAFVGLVQLIRRKSLLKVDQYILALGCFFIVVIALYVLFEVLVINYRPVIMPGETEPEASYPSSHTMLIITVMGSSMMMLRKYVQSPALSTALKLICAAVICVTVLGRLWCGVHWLTDIIGSIILSAALLTGFSAVLDVIDGRTPAKHAKHS